MKSSRQLFAASRNVYEAAHKAQTKNTKENQPNASYSKSVKHIFSQPKRTIYLKSTQVRQRNGSLQM